MPLRTAKLLIGTIFKRTKEKNRLMLILFRNGKNNLKAVLTLSRAIYTC
jgi:hypothetical protein